MTPDPANSPRSERRKTWSPGLVWAIPLAALLIVAYLGIQALIHRGEVVTVTFSRAAGARPHETKVLYQGVEAGQLIKIVPNEDGRRLDFQLRLVPQANAGLNSNARFWLIGASPTFSDLSSLRAVVSRSATHPVKEAPLKPGLKVSIERQLCFPGIKERGICSPRIDWVQ
jgi:paraquat-inducible protein B